MQNLFSNPPVEDERYYEIPTIHESAIMARRIMHLSTLGNLVTAFPYQRSSDEPATQENRPNGVEGSPIGLMVSNTGRKRTLPKEPTTDAQQTKEYYADCESNGNPTLLAINIATPFRNYDAGSNISLSVRWWPRASNIYSPDSGYDIPTPRTPAALPRFSLHGRLEPISTSDLFRKFIPACFLRSHPDSVLWQPGNDISHASEYMRLVVEHVYWFGGFGDRARIGWLPLEEWQGVTMEEIDECRLPGEEEKKKKKKKGWWREWL